MFLNVTVLNNEYLYNLVLCVLGDITLVLPVKEPDTAIIINYFFKILEAIFVNFCKENVHSVLETAYRKGEISFYFKNTQNCL